MLKEHFIKRIGNLVNQVQWSLCWYSSYGEMQWFRRFIILYHPPFVRATSEDLRALNFVEDVENTVVSPSCGPPKWKKGYNPILPSYSKKRGFIITPQTLSTPALRRPFPLIMPMPHIPLIRHPPLRLRNHIRLPPRGILLQLLRHFPQIQA